MPNRLATLGAALAVIAALEILQASPTSPNVAQAASPPAPPRFETRGDLEFDGIPAPRAELAAALAPWLESRSARFVDWLPGGGMLIATRFADAEQLHRVDAPLGSREQLTWSAEPVIDARMPQAAGAPGFVFLAGRAAAGAQLWYQRLGDHALRRVGDGESRYGEPRWSRDGQRVAFYRVAADGAGCDIYVAEPAAGVAPRLVLAGGAASWRPLDWSLDGSRLLVLKAVTVSEAELYLVDVASGALTPVDPAGGSGGRAGVGAAKFAPDGRGVYLVADRDGEFRQLRYYDTVTREERVVSPGLPGDVTGFDVSADGRYLAWVADVEGASQLTVIDTVQHTDLALPALPAGTIGRLAFDPAGYRLGFTFDPVSAPADVYAFDLEHGLLERWTQSEAGPLDARRLVGPTRVRYPSWDRVDGKPRQIAARLYRPAAGEAAAVPAAGGGSRHPVLIRLDDEAGVAVQPRFDPFVQFLVNERGFLVVEPEVRGTLGQGRSYAKLGGGTLRADAVRDVGALLVWLGLQPDVDRERIFVAGSGYGGYLALASLAAYGDRLRGGIDLGGISNFVTWLESAPEFARDQRRGEYGDERAAPVHAFLERISPLSNAASIRSPLLVIHGEADTRVPPAESAQLVASLRAHGGEAWYLTAKGEDAGLRTKSSRDASLVTAASFLVELSLRGEDAPGLRQRADH